MLIILIEYIVFIVVKSLRYSHGCDRGTKDAKGIQQQVVPLKHKEVFIKVTAIVHKCYE